MMHPARAPLHPQSILQLLATSALKSALACDHTLIRVYTLNPNPRHFEPQALEAAIEMGLPRVEAGAQGEHKIQRGYLPSLTHSSHYIRDPDFRGAVSHVRFGCCRSCSLLWRITQHAHGADCWPI
jgi:Peptidogalycan biosysnthesis/recognition